MQQPTDAIILAHQSTLHVGPLTVEPALLRLSHSDGHEEILQPRVMQVLVALLRAEGQILTRDALTASCWGGVVVGEDAINRVIARIRRVSGAIARGIFNVETITKVGFRLIRSAERHEGPALAPGSNATLSRSGKPAICVVPFVNMSDDPDQEYFSDGVSEDIMTDLSKVSALSVISRNTAFALKSKSSDVRALAQLLNVGYVLEGSVRNFSGRVRVSAFLTDAISGEQIWAERWDSDFTDIFALQDRISQAIVTALRVKLLPSEVQAIAKRGTTHADAFNLYLQARRSYLSGNADDAVRDHSIINLCRRAIEIDPSYARAWALMALTRAWSNDARGGSGDDGLAAAEQALQLDPDLAEAHAARAKFLAEQSLQDEAFIEVHAALRLDPESYEANETAGLLSYRQGRIDDAIAYFKKAKSLVDDGYFSPGMLVCCYAAINDQPNLSRAARDALASAERALSLDRSNGGALGFVVIALAALGEGDQVRDRIGRALLIDPDNTAMRYNFACALGRYLGDTEAALDLLQPFFEQTAAGFLKHAKSDPDLDSVRHDPRFSAMVAEAESRLAAIESGAEKGV